MNKTGQTQKGQTGASGRMLDLGKIRCDLAFVSVFSAVAFFYGFYRSCSELLYLSSRHVSREMSLADAKLIRTC